MKRLHIITGLTIALSIATLCEGQQFTGTNEVDRMLLLRWTKPQDGFIFNSGGTGTVSSDVTLYNVEGRQRSCWNQIVWEMIGPFEFTQMFDILVQGTFNEFDHYESTVTVDPISMEIVDAGRMRINSVFGTESTEDGLTENNQRHVVRGLDQLPETMVFSGTYEITGPTETVSGTWMDEASLLEVIGHTYEFDLHPDSVLVSDVGVTYGHNHSTDIINVDVDGRPITYGVRDYTLRLPEQIVLDTLGPDLPQCVVPEPSYTWVVMCLIVLTIGMNKSESCVKLSCGRND